MTDTNSINIFLDKKRKSEEKLEVLRKNYEELLAKKKEIENTLINIDNEFIFEKGKLQSCEEILEDLGYKDTEESITNPKEDIKEEITE